MRMSQLNLYLFEVKLLRKAALIMSQFFSPIPKLRSQNGFWEGEPKNESYVDIVFATVQLQSLVNNKVSP
jgi:hypothetical protein